MTRLLLHIGLVAVGSALGGLVRWGLHDLTQRLLGKTWPYGTFLINTTGCLLLGWLAAFLTHRLRDNHPDGVEELRLLIGVGFCGAYTTFSTFGVEADGLFRDGALTAGYLYIGLSVLVGLLAVRLGVWLAGGV